MLNSTEIEEVTIVCVTYNQIRYISECLDSLVNQNTTFKFKIIVYDDASSDGTSEVVLKFAELFPDLIVPLIQERNNYSRGISSISIIAPHIQGRYLAICEGDDYWCDEKKLQLQYDFMESHKEYSACCHSVKKYEDVPKKYRGAISPYDGERDVSVRDAIEGGGGFIGTNSLFFKSELFVRPEEFMDWGVGDWPTLIFLTLAGRVRFFPDSMAVYRINAKGSWSTRVSVDSRAAIRSAEKNIEGLFRLDEYSEGLLHESISKAIADQQIIVCIANRDVCRCITDHEFSKLSFRRRAKAVLEALVGSRRYLSLKTFLRTIR